MYKLFGGSNYKIMYKIKLLKEYTYLNICDIDFNVLIYFDYDDEVLLYSLRYEDHNYNSGEFLINYAKSFDEEVFDKEIKAFMLNHVWSEVNCHIEDNDYNDWTVSTFESGLKLKNKKTNQCIVWKIHDYEDECEFIQNEMIKFLNLQQTK